MGREVKRVPLSFDWPIDKIWGGYINPHHCAAQCAACTGSGYSAEAKRLSDAWYGKAPFKPEDRGSVPLTVSTPSVRAFAERNIENAPDFYGRGEQAIVREAKRLSDMWNTQWCHHLNADDVTALIESGRLMDFTHTWTKDTGWVKKEPPYVPTPQEVNEWGVRGFGHDAINQWSCVRAECRRLGFPVECAVCGGAGEIWPSQAAHDLYDAWEKSEPPIGDGYQIWETVSEGSPISPVFDTPEKLAKHMAETRWGADKGTPYETWLAFIRGPGWAPSMVVAGGRVMSGVEAVTV